MIHFNRGDIWNTGSHTRCVMMHLRSLGLLCVEQIPQTSQNKCNHAYLRTTPQKDDWNAQILVVAKKPRRCGIAPAQTPVLSQKSSTENGQFRVAGLRFAWTIQPSAGLFVRVVCAVVAAVAHRLLDYRLPHRQPATPRHDSACPLEGSLNTVMHVSHC